MKETHLIRQILDYCMYRDLLFWRNQAGAIKTPTGGLVKMGLAGSPDIIGVLDGRFIGVETKVGKNRQTPLQVEFEQKFRDKGGQYWLVYSLDEFISKLEQK